MFIQNAPRKTIKHPKFCDSDSLFWLAPPRTNKKRRDEDNEALLPLSSTGAFYESAFHSKNTPHTPDGSVGSLDVLVVTPL